MIKWCKFNRLDINWSKTYAMFVTNKKIELPTELNIAGNQIQIFNSIKILGVTISVSANTVTKFGKQ